MLLFLRFLPFVAALFLGGGAVWASQSGLSAGWILTGTWFMSVVVQILLIRTGPRRLRSWALLGIPLLFSAFGLLFFLFLESSQARIAIGILLAAGVFIWDDNLFFYVHAPAGYRVNSLEYLTLAVAITAIFFLSATGYGGVLFLQESVWFFAVAWMMAAWLLFWCLWWVCKKERPCFTAVIHAFVLVQLFAALSFLPSSPFVNASLLALAAYTLFGLQRAQTLHRIGKRLVGRFSVVVIVLAVIVIGTARWK